MWHLALPLLGNGNGLKLRVFLEAGRFSTALLPPPLNAGIWMAWLSQQENSSRLYWAEKLSSARLVSVFLCKFCI
jgi:hypothetical protein